jgi:hypothetical protein
VGVVEARVKGWGCYTWAAEIKRTFDEVVGNEAVGGCVLVLNRRVPIHLVPGSVIFTLESLGLKAFASLRVQEKVLRFL